ncbi:MAG: Flp pilus assembly complex ATPase component TadA, partial [Phycisphaerae bacterium]|nr:Flp pilus assembly complex ATPase component TadA [Phycisphaerae bacterium]
PLLVLLAGGLYVPHRNGLVTPHMKIFNGEWFRRLMERKGEGVLTVHQRIRIYGRDGRPVVLNDAQQLDPDAVNEYNIVQDLLHAAASGRASEVDVAPRNQQQATVRFVVDGIVAEQPPMPLADADLAIRFIKDKAGIDPEDREDVQKGKISIDIAGTPVDMEVATTHTPAGQRMRILVIQELVQTNANTLGMGEAMLEQIDQLMQTNGILICSGPPKSGVTSTQYSLLKRQDPFMRLLATVEATCITDIDNITQNEYGETPNLPKQLATAMRRDPDVILVDQVPDQQTAQQICDFANDKYVLAGMHAKDSFSALVKWLKAVGNIRSGLANLRGVLCQMLVRKLCPDCREPYQPDPQLLKKLGLPPQRVGQLYHPPTVKPKDKNGEVIPCPTCGDSGYYGRTGVFELLVVDDTFKQVMMSNPTRETMRAAAQKNKMRFIQEQAIQKVVAGETSLEEVIRVNQQLKAGQASKA